MSRAVRGDADALGSLAAAHRPVAYRIAAAMLGDRDAAEDVAQDVFVRLAVALPELRPDTDLSAWIYRVTVNACRDRLRALRRRARDVAVEDVIDAPELASDSGLDRDLDLENVRGVLARAVKRLPREQREVIVMRYVRGLPYAEIARVTALAPGTIASRLFRALKRLGEELDPRHLEVLE